MFPPVRDLAVDGISVTVTCRVLEWCRHQYCRWLAEPFTDTELDEGNLANAVFDARRDDPEFGYRFLADEVRAGGFVVGDRTVWQIFSERLVAQLRQGKICLCAIKDLCSKRTVGWAIDERMKARLVVATIELAVARRGEVAGRILQSDRGSQFRSRKVQRCPTRHRMVGSMGKVGTAADRPPSAA